MHAEIDALVCTRRRLLLGIAGAAALCGRAFAFASDFWNKKGPADWSDDEVHQLLSKSPWAKQVTSEVARSGGGGGGNRSGSGGGGGGNTGMGGGGSRGGGMGGGGSRGGGGGIGNTGGVGGMGNPAGTGNGGGGGATPRPAGQTYKGVVRWESAKPVVEASKSTLPDVFADHYVISLSGFPLAGRRPDAGDAEPPKLSKNALDRIKAATSLTPKGKEAVHADAAQVVGTALMLGFARNSLKLSPDDKEVAFVTMINRMVIKTKFNFKEMMYHETLAI